MKSPRKSVLVALLIALALAAVAWPIRAADTPAPPNAAPNGQAPGGRKGGGRGGPLTDADRAYLARLQELPPWKPGVGNGDFAMSPPYTPAPENAPRAGVPKGRVETFHLPLAGSKYYPPVAGRDGKLDPAAAREVVVYIPAGYVPGTPAPLLLTHDAMGAHDREPAPHLPTILDNLIADKRVPAMVAVMVMPSNQRSLEYDTVSGQYAEFIEEEVLPRVAKDHHVTFTKDPKARATMGGSSGAAAALSMAWFHPELYARVLAYSGTFVNLRNGPHAPHGAWEYHENFIPKTTPNKPLRIWLQVGERDNGATSSGAGMFNWVIANQRMAEALKAKGYAYQFVFCKEAGHVDRPARAQTLAPALEWLWQDYTSAAK